MDMLKTNRPPGNAIMRKLLTAAFSTIIILNLHVSAQPFAGPPTLPASAKARIASLTAHPRVDTLWREARDRALASAINPDDYQCGPTDFDAWFGGKLDQIQNFDAFIDIAFNFAALDWATFY